MSGTTNSVVILFTPTKTLMSDTSLFEEPKPYLTQHQNLKFGMELHQSFSNTHSMKYLLRKKNLLYLHTEMQ